MVGVWSQFQIIQCRYALWRSSPAETLYMWDKLPIKNFRFTKTFEKGVWNVQKNIVLELSWLVIQVLDTFATKNE